MIKQKIWIINQYGSLVNTGIGRHRFLCKELANLGYKVSVLEKMCRAIDLNGSLAVAKSEMQNCGVEFI